MSGQSSCSPTTRSVISPHCDLTMDRQSPGLLTVHDVPDFAKEISINTGYRSVCLGYQGCVQSIFSLHNETVNIWTHLLGFVFFFCLMVRDLVWPQGHIRDKTDYNATLLQLVTYQVQTVSCHLRIKLTLGRCRRTAKYGVIFIFDISN